MKRFSVFSKCALIILLVGVFVGKGFADDAVLSNTQPKINLTHIFEGEINKNNKPVGFHSRPGGKDPGKNGIQFLL